MNITIIKEDFKESSYEFVERKGKGHPDTLSDNLAEYLSAKYSQYTRKNFGVILHHNFDKVGMLGGASDVGFGYGRLIKPIRILLNGRASTKFGDKEINVKNLLTKWAKEFMLENLPITNPDEELEFHYNQSNQSSPGKTEEDNNKKKSARKYWFEPRNLNDIPELKKLVSNDTSIGVGFAPYSRLELLILDIEKTLNGSRFKESNKWIGSDIKIMGFRNEEDFKVTMCIPQIGPYVNSIGEYKDNVIYCRKIIEEIVKKHHIDNFELDINTRDNYEKGELYLTVIGSSIESGDEGLVGRGNRIQGVISPTRPMSMEGVAGKNPVYHIGKLYYIAAQKISEKIYKEFGVPNSVALISQSGRDLLDPWVTFIHVPELFEQEDKIKKFAEEIIVNIPNITNSIIEGEISVC